MGGNEADTIINLTRCFSALLQMRMNLNQCEWIRTVDECLQKQFDCTDFGYVCVHYSTL